MAQRHGLPDDLLEAKAAHIETGGGEDSTSVSWESLKGDADQVFSLALELFLHPKFSAEKLELAQQQAATGIVRRNDDEGEIAERESTKLVYGANSPYARQPELAAVHAVVGTEEEQDPQHAVPEQPDTRRPQLLVQLLRPGACGRSR